MSSVVFKEVAAAFDALAEHADEASELWPADQPGACRG
jgi:hypothetical protein